MTTENRRVAHADPPRPDEYDPYYAGYVERVGGGDALAVLRARSAVIPGLLRTVGEEQALHRYAPGKWSLKEVLGHVIDTERVFAHRALSIARLDGQPQPGFDQDAWVVAGGFDRRSRESLAAEHEAVRRGTLALFESFGPSDWTATGIANGVRFSVRAIAAIIAGHEAHHLTIVRRRYLGEGGEDG